jgi:membrane associated rhomboid family serine protease
MSETELSVICKNCGSEVSPYVTECPYCGARLRKRAPKLERRGDGLEATPRRRPGGRLRKLVGATGAERPYATAAVVGGSALILLVQKATGASLAEVGGLEVPLADQLWRVLSAPYAYIDVGYLFVVAIAMAIFGVGLERRLGTTATAILFIACGSLGMLAGSGIADTQGGLHFLAGGNGLALGAVAAWFTIRRAETHSAVDQDYDKIGVAVAAVVLLALPIFDSAANVYAGIAGGAIGALAGLLAATLRSE